MSAQAAKGTRGGGEPNPPLPGCGSNAADGSVPSKRQKLTHSAEGVEADEGDSDNNNPVEGNRETNDQVSDDSDPLLTSSGSDDDEEKGVAARLQQEHDREQEPVNTPEAVSPAPPLDSPAPEHPQHDREWTPAPANENGHAGVEFPSPRRLVRSRNQLQFLDE